MSNIQSTHTAADVDPLHETHAQAEAEFQPYGAIEIVSTFGEPQAEYAAIRKTAGMLDLPQRGLIELTGKDRHPFLNNLLTQQTYDKTKKEGITAGQALYAFLLDAKTGRIITDLHVLECGDRTLLEMEARLTPNVKTILEKYLFAEQVKIADRTGELHEIALHGPKSLEVLIAAAGSILDPFKPLELRQIELFSTPTIIWRDDPAGVPGYHLIVPSQFARTVWMNLLAKFSTGPEAGKRALRPIGWAVYNATRIEGGRPLFGIDFDDTILPAETGQLARAVSFTKGCYPGQEIVARMYARKQVAKQIVGLRMADDAVPIAGVPIYDENSNQIGGITSSTISPVLSNAGLALGFLKKNFLAVGTVVNVPAEGSMRKAVVTELPFLSAKETTE